MHGQQHGAAAPALLARIRLIDWCVTLLPSITGPQLDLDRARASLAYNRALLLHRAGDRRASLQGYTQLIGDFKGHADPLVRGLVLRARVNRASRIAPRNLEWAVREWTVVLDEFAGSNEPTFHEPAAFAAAHVARADRDLPAHERASLVHLARRLADASTEDWSPRVLRITAA